MKVMITGGAGFMGSNLIRFMVNKYPDYHFINFDKLTYAGNIRNLEGLDEKPNYAFVRGDVNDINLLIHLLHDVDVVIHLAAESHVDNSITYHDPKLPPSKRTLGNSLEFTRSNTLGTHCILEAAKAAGVKKFIHMSTDEVYGDVIDGSAAEDQVMLPNNPYSASKAAAEMIARAHLKTYKTPVIIVRSNNVYGPRQYPEKIIPRFITNILCGEKLPLHGDGSNIRTYIYATDYCRAMDTIFRKGEIGEVYNIGTNDEISNLELTRLILEKMGGDESMIEHVEDRPHNDKRYSVDYSKLRNLGWSPEISFEDGLGMTIEWYKNNVEWWKEIRALMAKRTIL